MQILSKQAPLEGSAALPSRQRKAVAYPLVRGLAVVVAILLCQPALSQAGMVTFSGSGKSDPSLSADDLFATVKFETSGTNLIITLTNISDQDVTKTSQLLTAVFFDLAGNPNLTRVSAVLGPNAVVLYANMASNPAAKETGTVNGDGVVGGEFSYARSTSSLSGVSQKQGISSSGFSIFGKDNLFPGPDLDKPKSPDGSNYGITSAGDDPNTGNNGLIDDPIIKNSVVFTLSGLPAGFNVETGVTNVCFQYGTDLSEPHFSGKKDNGGGAQLIPAPPAVLLMGIGGLGFIGLVTRVRRQERLAA
jgi:hypothetical protein